MVRPLTGLLAALALLGSLLAPAGAAQTPRAALTAPASEAAEAGTYTNPVSAPFADTYADPAVILAKDGWWYAYATADPLRAGDEPGIGHIARTRDWAHWEYLGTIFDETNRPSWAEPTAGLWAPDIRYLDGQYVLYFTVTDTTLNPGEDSAIGVATSADPAGPWLPADAPVVAPRPDGGGFLWTFDPAGFTDTDGSQWLYYGSYYGGVHVTEVTSDGLTPVGEPTQVTIGDRYEGTYVVEHDGWYYLMASSANCCAGPATGYSVFAGRSSSPRGPFLDADGLDLNASVTGGTTMLTQNGNTWIGAGHHALFTDAQGRTFVAYHAIDHAEPWLTAPYGINRRPMLIDRVDWIEGWPTTRAGQGPSDTPQPLPVTASLLGITPHDPAGAFTGATGGSDPQAGSTAVVAGTATSRERAPAGDLRVRLDVSDDAPLTVEVGAFPRRVLVAVDPQQGTLTTAVLFGNGSRRASTETVDPWTGWHALTVEVVGSQVHAELSQADLGDPKAVVTLDRPGLALRSAPVTLRADGAQVDNLFVARPVTEQAAPAPTPQPGAVLLREDFEDAPGTGEDGWSWVRPDDGIVVQDGDLVWPVRSVDLVGPGGSGALLLRDPPEGDWIVETTMTLDLGEDSVRNYQQAGLVVHASDDDVARLGSVAIWNTRTVEYGRELAADPDDPSAGLIYAGAIIGAPAATTTLRIAHTTHDTGEHVYRAGISRNGQDWVWGAAWTMPAGADPRIGLYAGGGAQPEVSARFHDVTVYRWDG